MTEELKNARNRVLVDNTAQAVFKHLDRLEDKRTTLGLRWIWELLQNARDSARTDGVHITVRLSDSELRFEHDGKPFDSDEIAHLVYHGSTKIEDFENVGQFGSGFLSTHLLSRVVRVGGCLNNSRQFAFSLDRAGATVEQLRLAMERSWEAFEQSVEDATSAPTFSTSFVYDVIEEQSLKLAQEGLNDLHRYGPLVLAFCPEITSIAVETAEAAWSLERGGSTPLHEGDLLSIQCQQDGQTLSRFVAVAEGKAELCAALQLCPSESGFRVDLVQELTPKLFILFPLIGSERLGLPVTINSKQFKPHEDRDGIVLLGDSTGARENRQLLKDSVRHQRQLLEWCAKEKWNGSERLLAFEHGVLPDWVGAEDPWFLALLTDLVRSAQATPLMPTLGGDWIKPQAAWIPTAADESHRVWLWELMSSWSGASARLPCRDHLVSWWRNLSNWANLLSKSPPEMDEALTTDVVAQLISEAGSVKDLQERLASVESLSWLISLLRLVQEAGDTKLFNEYNLLPSQAGCLRRCSDLRRDERISDELKDIAEAFKLNIRNELLDAHAEVDGIDDLLVSEREPDLLDKLLARVKEECHDGTIDSSLAPWVIKLFWWMMARSDYVNRLAGYPAPTTAEGDNRTTVLYLAPGCDASDRPMAPLATWPEGAQQFASLFPKRKILAEAFADRDPDRWRPLVKRGYVNMSPLIETKRAMNAFLPDDPLPETDGIDSHESTQEIQVSDIIFLNEKDIGLIDTARKSKTRATEFIRFLVEFVIATDDRAFEESSVDCECEQSHKIYRAAWLVPLHRRQWVPLESTGRRAARASAESLARLLADSPDIAELLLGERGEKLLRALGISRADLALRAVADDEETRVALIHSMKALAEATDGNVDRVRDLANEIREHPEIIDSIEEQKVRRKKIQRNQDIGLIVENLLRQELEGRGLTVRHTGRGSDFEVESDYVKNNEEVWLELVDSRVSTFIEVKSTRVDQVKMTPLQVESACSLDDRFALCVVPLDDDTPTRQTISENLRVVFAIGVHLKSALADYKSLRGAADEARRPQGPHDAIEIEIIEGQVRFQIGRSIWGDALTLEQAVDRFAGRGLTSVDKASSPDQDPM